MVGNAFIFLTVEYENMKSTPFDNIDCDHIEMLFKIHVKELELVETVRTSPLIKELKQSLIKIRPLWAASAQLHSPDLQQPWWDILFELTGSRMPVGENHFNLGHLHEFIMAD